MATAYVVAWSIYAGAAIGLLASGWRLTDAWPARIRGPVRTLAIGLVVPPVALDAQAGQYAPAMLVALFEGVLKRDGDPVAALAALLVAGVLAGVVMAVLGWWRHRRT